ncbi:integrase/recombinase XerC [Oxalobacteraceae bacterium GrIS 1.11]
MTCNVFQVGKIWHYRFEIRGVRIQRTTREVSKRRAEPIARKAYADALTLAHGGQLVPTLAELIAQWLVIRAPTASAAHVRSVDIFARHYLYGMGDLPINAITTMLVEVARNEHLLTHKPASANHWLSLLKLVTNWAVKRDILPALPWRVSMLKVQQRPRVTLPLRLAKDWFAAIDAKAGKRIGVGTAIRLMYGMGLRASEAAGARWEWIDWERRTYTPGVTKGREAEPVTMAAWLIDHLTPLRQFDGLIAPRQCGKQLPAGYARLVMQHANSVCATAGVTPHRLRGTYATLLSEAGVPIQTIQALMRHKHPMTTMGYLERNFAVAERAQNGIGLKANIGRREIGERPPAKPHRRSFR